MGTKFDLMKFVNALADRALKCMDSLSFLRQLLIAALWFGTFEVPKELKERFRKEAESTDLDPVETEKRISNALEDEYVCGFFVEGLFVKVEFYLPRTNTILRVDWPSMLRPDGMRPAKTNLMTKCFTSWTSRNQRVFGFRLEKNVEQVVEIMKTGEYSAFQFDLKVMRGEEKKPAKFRQEKGESLEIRKDVACRAVERKVRHGRQQGRCVVISEFHQHAKLALLKAFHKTSKAQQALNRLSRLTSLILLKWTTSLSVSTKRVTTSDAVEETETQNSTVT